MERLEREHGRVVITKHGRPAAVVLSVEDLEGLEETLDLISDRRVLAKVRKASREIDSGQSATLTKKQALDLIIGGLGRALQLELLGLQSARRGEYRIIYRIDEEHHVIHLAAIEHRAAVYRLRQAMR